jgi:hypothetical protein
LISLAVASTLLYWLVFRIKLNKYNSNMATFSSDNCIAEPAGVNKAIGNINTHERKILDSYDD